MMSLHVGSRELPLNGKGFLARFDDWNREVAIAMAEEEGLQLSECHWATIEFLRDYYKTYDIPPSPRVIIKSIGEKLTQYVPCTYKHLDALFPGGGCKQACRIAGLPEHYCHSC